MPTQPNRMGTGSFPGVKRSGSGVDNSSPRSTEVKERVELYIYSPSGSSWPVCRVNFISSYFALFLRAESQSVTTALLMTSLGTASF